MMLAVELINSIFCTEIPGGALNMHFPKGIVKINRIVDSSSLHFLTCLIRDNCAHNRVSAMLNKGHHRPLRSFHLLMGVLHLPKISPGSFFIMPKYYLFRYKLMCHTSYSRPW